jgi:hypothetical protein
MVVEFIIGTISMFGALLARDKIKNKEINKRVNTVIVGYILLGIGALIGKWLI